MIAFIDGGTTNSRVYLYEHGSVISEGWKKVGVKDTAIDGHNKQLQQAIYEAVMEASTAIHRSVDEIKCFITSGMITSELGLLEIPHLIAPVNKHDLAQAIVRVQDTTIFPFDIPVFFIRGIKNRLDYEHTSINQLRNMDFMRGEEVQVAGILDKYQPTMPVNILIIGSHTKLIHINQSGDIAGSLTTISGQFYEALINGTFIGKCTVDDGKSEPLFDLDAIIDIAMEAVDNSCLLRAMLMPRFMHVLMESTAKDRRNFINACIAAEDIKMLNESDLLGFTAETDYYLFGNAYVCDIYRRLLERKFENRITVHSLTNKKQIRDLTISGSLAIAKAAGVIDEFV